MSAPAVLHPDDEFAALCCDAFGSANAFTESRSYPSGVTFLGTAEWITSECLVCPDCGQVEEL